MSRASAHGLSTPRAADWRDAGACRDEDPELFFPLGTEGRWAIQIEQAKAVCARCPVLDACGQWALDNPRLVPNGVFGGLTDAERRNLRRRETRAGRKKVLREARPNMPPAKTLQEAFDRRTQATGDGHIRWSGQAYLEFGGQRYAATRVAFATGHGREPVGIVRRTCGVADCIRHDHLSDQVIRETEDRCGTRAGYLRHRARGEDCEVCRKANTDADNRLRRTGTTKVAA